MKVSELIKNAINISPGKMAKNKNIGDIRSLVFFATLFPLTKTWKHNVTYKNIIKKQLVHMHSGIVLSL